MGLDTVGYLLKRFETGRRAGSCARQARSFGCPDGTPKGHRIRSDTNAELTAGAGARGFIVELPYQSGFCNAAAILFDRAV